MSVTDLLRACPLFYELYEKEIEKIVSHCQVIPFEVGEKIIKDGDEGNEIYVVLDGQAVVQKKTATGIIKIQPLNPGDVFGEMVLIDQKLRTADIVAEKFSYILEIKYEDIFSLYKKEPKIFGLMILNLARLISQRLKASNDIIVNLKNKIPKAA